MCSDLNIMFLPTKMRFNTHIIKQKLKTIVKNIGHFPSRDELIITGNKRILTAIKYHGGFTKFRTLLNQKLIRKPNNYWNNASIVKELNIVIKQIGHFPLQKELYTTHRTDLKSAIILNRGLNYYRKTMGYGNPVTRPNGFWTQKRILKHLNAVITKTEHFPTVTDFILNDRNDLLRAIHRNGGLLNFRELLGYKNEHTTYKSKLSSYCSKRGKNSENIVKKIIEKYCKFHTLPKPRYNIKLSEGNIIEFICNTEKTIGIDVTNTKTKRCITNKWTTKNYHKYVDELWIVVFSDSFKKTDYIE